jgi:hypothetical protein
MSNAVIGCMPSWDQYPDHRRNAEPCQNGIFSCAFKTALALLAYRQSQSMSTVLLRGAGERAE